MNEPASRKHALFEKYETNAPVAFLNGLTAMAAFRLAARRRLRAIDARETPVLQAHLSGALQGLTLGEELGGLRERFQQRLRPPIGSAKRMEPQRHFAFGEGIGEAFSKAQRTLLDGSRATAAFGSAAWSELENMGHLRILILTCPPCAVCLCCFPRRCFRSGRCREPVASSTSRSRASCTPPGRQW